MKLGKPHHLWLKGLLAMGLFLSFLLLVQSAYTYYHVSRQLVTDQLAREADRQVLAAERGIRQSEASSAEQQRIVLEDILQDNAAKIAWMRIIDATGKAVVEAGKPTGAPLAAGDARAVRTERGRTPELRDTPNGRVMVYLLPLRLMRSRPGPEGARAGPRPPAASPSPEGGRFAARPPGAPQGPRLLEIALYLESASSAFSPLRRNLIVSILAALGLAAAMILFWVQFPRYVRGKQLEEQLELARKVQADLLPPSNPALGGLDFAAACVPAWQVGGDFYDVFTTNQDNVAVVLGDVAGKGLPAALLMGMLHGALRSMRWMETPADQEITWRQLNYLLSSRTAPERFASLFWGSYDREARIIRYVNAGHLPPLLMRRNGMCTIRRLEEGGPILGMISTATYQQGEVAVQPGDLLVLYSDGIVEAASPSEEEFGEERLCGIIQENCARPSAEILDEILKQVRAYIQDNEPQDDMTLVVARIN
ncbi:MAG: PP2C family protein-serine/threonine phosphatase [Acidobacteriia bacterium]|nr:PP2C family protein-serine/threonine phosphatase [Terriglobia bacterium]